MTHLIADVLIGLVQFGSLILMIFVFYAVLQIVRVVREELDAKQEKRFERWYRERIVHPRHAPPKE